MSGSATFTAEMSRMTISWATQSRTSRPVRDRLVGVLGRRAVGTVHQTGSRLELRQ